MKIKGMLRKIIITIMLFSACMYSQIKDGVYNYPVKPGMPEWKLLNAHTEMIKVLQIPENILKSLSTKNLLETCLEYPLFFDMFAFNSLQTGYESVKRQFNGLLEFYEREDAADILMDKYASMNTEGFNKNWSFFDKGNYAAYFSKIEMILSQDHFINKYSEEKRTLLLRCTYEKNSMMSEHPDVYYESLKKTNYMLMGRIMMVSNNPDYNNLLKEDNMLKIFTEKGTIPDKLMKNKILSFVSKLLNG